MWSFFFPPKEKHRPRFILNIVYGTYMGKNSKNIKNVVSFFFRRRKNTEKCDSGEVGRRSYVPAKKKNYPPLPMPTLFVFSALKVIK